MDEVNDCIAKSSEGEELVDQPEVDRRRTRVSGPFTAEAVQPAEESLDIESPIGGEPDEPVDTYDIGTDGQDAVNAEAYLDQMIRLLRNDGVQFPNNRTQKFATLNPLEGDVLHAEGSWEDDDTERLVAVVFGPQHGPVTQCKSRIAYPLRPVVVTMNWFLRVSVSTVPRKPSSKKIRIRESVSTWHTSTQMSQWETYSKKRLQHNYSPSSECSHSA